MLPRGGPCAGVMGRAVPALPEVGGPVGPRSLAAVLGGPSDGALGAGPGRAARGPRRPGAGPVGPSADAGDGIPAVRCTMKLVEGGTLAALVADRSHRSALGGG